MKNMIFVTGFARGGTSWLRDCIASHPEVQLLPKERTIFRKMNDSEVVRNYFQEEVIRAGLDLKKHVVNKAPANAPYIAKAAKAFPQSKFIFIIRDPRDVLISHQRGEQDWMGGKNSTVEGCLRKTQTYFAGWLEAKDLPNVLLVRYEDLHQDFYQTMKTVFDFVKLPVDTRLLKNIYEKNDFRSKTDRKNIENRQDAKRKGVIGDWMLHLSESDKKWLMQSSYWSNFMATYGYDWNLITYPNILEAMNNANCHFLSEDDLLTRSFDQSKTNIILFHDIDDLNSSFSAGSILDSAKAEAKFNVPAIYNFLPLDDVRYKKTNTKDIKKLIDEILYINPKASIALHFNAAEKFFPAASLDYGDNTPDLFEAYEYLNFQIDEYEKIGIKFQMATAHGYGRGKKRPNNLFTPEFTDKLLERNIEMFDTVIRPDIIKKAPHYSVLTDVGGAIRPRRMLSNKSIISQECYDEFPKGTVLRFLTHPGNYECELPAVLAMRHFILPK